MKAPAATAVAVPNESVVDSPVHRLPAHVKMLASVSFVAIVVMTPPTLWPAFIWYAILVVAVALIARLRLRSVARRLAVEIPFIVFALLLPILGRPPTTEVLGLTLSEPGLLAAWNIIAKATLGVAASAVLAATTQPQEMLDGLARLRVPDVMVQITAFMLRYVHVVSEQWRRMGQARAARGFEVGGPRSWPTLARSAGVLFIRSYERGERVHLAMLSRGYVGGTPVIGADKATARELFTASLLPVAALLGLAATSGFRP